MPGIAGIIRKARYDGIDGDLEVMTKALCHDERTRSGKLVDESLGLWVGWACHPGSYADCMPLVTHDENVVIVFKV